MIAQPLNLSLKTKQSRERKSGVNGIDEDVVELTSVLSAYNPWLHILPSTWRIGDCFPQFAEKETDE